MVLIFQKTSIFFDMTNPFKKERYNSDELHSDDMAVFSKPNTRYEMAK
jgi:hypothetical protein